MAFAQSHKIEYKDSADIDTRIEIWTDGYMGSVQECEAAEDPLNIDIAPFNQNVFTPVIGTGATMNVISVTNGQFMGLYTINPTKRMVKIFKNNASYPWWLGYINAEQYGEGYSRAENYPVTINCNDGFNILGRFKYIDGSGNNYKTIETNWNILKRIITKMGLPFQYLYFASILTPDGVTIGSSECLFHQLKADQNNYNNEQDLPMTFRDVLEALLKSYGLQIRWYNGCIIVYEPQMLAEASFTAKRFDSSFSYVSSGSLTFNLDITNGDINWDNEDQAFDTVAGNSKQVIRFSPYSYDHAQPVIDITDALNWTGTPAWTETHKPAGGASIYYLSGITAVNGFTLGAHASLTGKRTTLYDDPEIYFQCDYGIGTGDVFLQNTLSGRFLGGIRGSSILFKTKIYLNTKTWENDSVFIPSVVKSLIFKIAIEVGSKRPVAANPAAPYEWITSTTDFFYIKAHDSGNAIDNRWIDVVFQIPWNFPSGELVIKIFDDFKAYDDITKWINDTPITVYMVTPQVRFKDIEFPVIDVKDPSNGGRIGYNYANAALDDKKFTGTINEQFQNEGSEITLVHADAVNCSDRGAIRKYDETFTTGWKKTGDATSFLLPMLLLRSIISQYQDSLAQLSGTIEASALMASNGGPSFLFTLQDSDYLSTKKLLFAGGSYNDFKRTLNGSFLEIKQEDLTINVE